MRIVLEALKRNDLFVKGGQVRVRLRSEGEAKDATNEIRSAGLMARWTNLDDGPVTIILEDPKKAWKAIVDAFERQQPGSPLLELPLGLSAERCGEQEPS